MTSLAVLQASSTLDSLDSGVATLDRHALLGGEVLVKTKPHTNWGGAVTASMYLPVVRSCVWQQLTNYPRWVEYFPDLIRSEVLQTLDSSAQSGCKRLYQTAEKAFLFFSAQVEIYLRVFETVLDSARQHIAFRLEKGSFLDFTADLTLQDWEQGTLLTYTVQATPTLPVPALIIEQAMRLELPANMRVMRQVLRAG